MAKTAEYGLGEFAFPRGWFMVGTSEDATAIPKPVRFFGRDMVLYRGKASGRAILMDAYCPHMRVHLGRNSTSYVVKDGGQVEGDSIRCPAHGWRFGSDGKCDDIPYSTHGIPKAACIKTHQVVERAGCIWMWHDMENGAPNFDLPEFAEYEQAGEGWVPWTMDDLGTLPIHPQEILDNLADFAHFGPVHGTVENAYFQNDYDDHVMRQYFGSGHRTLVEGGAMLETDAWYTGPGILISRMAGKHPALMMICNTPVEDGEVRVWFGVMSKTAEGRPANAEEKELARAYHVDGMAAFEPDFELWKYKQPALTILQIPDDGPFHKGRIWNSQFYNPREREAAIRKRVNGTYTTMSGSGSQRQVA